MRIYYSQFPYVEYTHSLLLARLNADFKLVCVYSVDCRTVFTACFKKKYIFVFQFLGIVFLLRWIVFSAYIIASVYLDEKHNDDHLAELEVSSLLIAIRL